MKKSLTKSYTELMALSTFEERFDYLKSEGFEGFHSIFGSSRHLNQSFYNSKEWQRARRIAIARDQARDLGIEGREINYRIMVHHINNVTIEDLINGDPSLTDPENLICCSHNTHQAITYGDENILYKIPEPRRKGDTCPWKTAY